MSFWLDWWMLISIGLVITLIVRNLSKVGVKWNNYTLLWFRRLVLIVVIIIFYLFSVGLFCGFTHYGGPGGNQTVGPDWLATLNDWFFGLIKWFWAPYYQLYPSATSTEFMFSSAQPWLRNLLNIQFNDLAGLTDQPLYLFFSIIIFALYPWFLRLGALMGEMLFGTKPGKKGLWHASWIIVFLILLIIVPLIAYFSLQASIIDPFISALIIEIIVIVFFLLNILLFVRKH